MPDDEGLHHRWLFQYRGSFSARPDNGVPVITGSLEEQQIISRLDYFLKEHPTIIDEELYDSDNYRLRQLKKLFDYIPLREPCFASEVRAEFLRRI